VSHYYWHRGSRLWIAYRQGGELHREFIIAGNRLEVTQLDNAIFLINNLQQSPGTKGSTYAMDLNSGKIRQISETSVIRCLRSEPSRKTAMLVDSNRIPGEDRLTEIDLTSLTTNELQVLSKSSLGDEYLKIRHPIFRQLQENEDSKITNPFMISPDFLHIAYVIDKVEFEYREYELKSLNLRTLKTEVLDRDVKVHIPGISSDLNAFPPFEWINNNQVLYQHMVDAGWIDALCAFKIVDIRTKEISERFRKQLRMELGGGQLATDPLTGRLILNRKYVLDYSRNQLTDRILPFTAVTDLRQEKTEIKSVNGTLYSGSAMCLGTCMSASGSSFAYALTPSYGASSAEVYAVFGGDLKPLKVAEGYSSVTRPIGWIQ
jgi:hypothetical protein